MTSSIIILKYLLLLVGIYILVYFSVTWLLKRTQKQKIDRENLLSDVSLTDPNLCVQIEMKPYRFFKKRLSKQDYTNMATQVLDLNEDGLLVVQDRAGKEHQIEVGDYILG